MGSESVITGCTVEPGYSANIITSLLILLSQPSTNINLAAKNVFHANSWTEVGIL